MQLIYTNSSQSYIQTRHLKFHLRLILYLYVSMMNLLSSILLNIVNNKQ